DDAQQRERKRANAALLLDRPVRLEADRAKRPRCHRTEGDQSEEHPDAGRRESPVPVHSLAKEAGDERREESAEIDASVEDREASVASRTAFGIEIADDRRHVRLEQSCSDDDQNEAEEERA